MEFKSLSLDSTTKLDAVQTSLNINPDYGIYNSCTSNTSEEIGFRTIHSFSTHRVLPKIIRLVGKCVDSNKLKSIECACGCTVTLRFNDFNQCIRAPEGNICEVLGTLRQDTKDTIDVLRCRVVPSDEMESLRKLAFLHKMYFDIDCDYVF